MSRKIWFGLVLFSAFLIYQFITFNVLQDDAFISFRYVKNFLAGHGLVFNIGERVEGYTNFLWIILLALLTKLGFPLITTARVLGVLFSVATIGLAAYAAQRYYPKRNWLWTLSVPLLLSANGALAYWAGSGLETGLFTLLVAAAAIAYFSSPALSFVFLSLSILTRPEGALLAFLFGVAGVLLKARTWKFTLQFWGALALIMLPYAIFKWLYFGSLLPNPFYAKTGFSMEYWKSGLEYAELFFKHYGLYGAALLFPLILWKKLTPFSRFCLLIFTGYTLYVVSVGGDVLKAHRFFVPVLVFLSSPLTDSFYHLLDDKPYKKRFFVLAVIILGLYSYRMPLQYLKMWALTEREGFNQITKVARFFAADSTVRTLAVTALGPFSYYVSPKRIIDMLGLVDAVVSKQSEKIEGLSSTWKERRFNAGYVLSQKPDVILFSTGLKPSALAERALFLYPDFRKNYRLELLYREGILNSYYRRFRDLPTENRPDLPASFVNLFNQATNLMGYDDQKAIGILREILAKGDRDFSVLYIMLGNVYSALGVLDSAELYLQKGMALDAGGSMGRLYYAGLLYKQKRNLEAATQDSILIQMVPNVAEFLRAAKTSF